MESARLAEAEQHDWHQRLREQLVPEAAAEGAGYGGNGVERAVGQRTEPGQHVAERRRDLHAHCPGRKPPFLGD